MHHIRLPHLHRVLVNCVQSSELAVTQFYSAPESKSVSRRSNPVTNRPLPESQSLPLNFVGCVFKVHIELHAL